MCTNLRTSATYILVNLAAFPPAIFCTRSVRSSPLSSVNCFDRSFFDLHHTVKPSCSPRYQTLPCSAGYVLGLELVRLDLAGHFGCESAEIAELVLVVRHKIQVCPRSPETAEIARHTSEQHNRSVPTVSRQFRAQNSSIITLRSVVGNVCADLAGVRAPWVNLTGPCQFFSHRLK